MRAPPLPVATVGWDLHISPSASAAAHKLIASQSLDERVDEGTPLPVATVGWDLHISPSAVAALSHTHRLHRQSEP